MPGGAASPARTVLVTGGVRSGKSRHAEQLLSGCDRVLYVAPGPTPDSEADPDWTARVQAHRSRRPLGWRTLEGHDVVVALGDAEPGEAVIVDCLGTWVTAVVDAHEAWEQPDAALRELVGRQSESLAVALAAHPGRVVVVTNEVGMGIVPAYRSGRVFRDLLGSVNQRVAEVCDEVHLVVAGRVLVL